MILKEIEKISIIGCELIVNIDIYHGCKRKENYSLTSFKNVVVKIVNI